MTKEEAILAAATRRLNENPTASMTDLAEATGISRATLHRHFATREALLHRLGLRAVGEWERIHREVGLADATRSGDPDLLARTMRDLVHGYLETIDAYGFVLTDHFIYGAPDLMAWIERLEKDGIGFIAAAQHAGVLNPALPPRWISDALYGLLIGARDSLRYGNVARRDIEDLLLTTFLRGVGPADRGTGT
ncbi:TetR/AcrR family transcriptional regulator [Spirillospora sp. NPDC029432]|uniref:TetR/AcrR family transcriptional regulator n=1 Tax=Spirillospora sp. NPDC029432 TaxID=3154599 RepID=UPI003454C10D